MYGSWPLSLADWIRLITAAARWPARSDPAKSQFDLPTAISQSFCPCRAGSPSPPPGQRWNHPGSLIAIRDRRAAGDERRGHSPRLAADQSPCPRTRRRPASRPPRRRPRRARPRHGPSFRRYASHGIAVEGAARRAGASDSGLGLPARHGQNDCEIAVGRSNWLFAGSLRAGQRAAAVMSLIQSAKLNGHDPYVYLKDVFTRLPTQPASRIDELLPHGWRPERAAA